MKVREIKEEVRNIYNIGFSSVHITDTKEEAIEISRLLFNENGLHFLNYAKVSEYESTLENIKIFKNFAKNNNISLNDLVLDSGMLLSLYGVRKCNDIDYFIDDSQNIIDEVMDIECHDSELKYHNELKMDLLYNPEYYFYFNDVKFVSFQQVYKMKNNRQESKDINDCKLMEALIENNNLKKLAGKVKQNILYVKVMIRKKLISFLKISGLYSYAKLIYDNKIRK